MSHSRLVAPAGMNHSSDCTDLEMQRLDPAKSENSEDGNGIRAGAQAGAVSEKGTRLASTTEKADHVGLPVVGPPPATIINIESSVPKEQSLAELEIRIDPAKSEISEDGNGIRVDAQAGAVSEKAIRQAPTTEKADHVGLPDVGPPPATVINIESSVPKEQGLAELEIRTLLWIEQPGNELYARAHEAWEKKDELFASRIDKKRKQSLSLRNENYQLIGYYSVFQGVLLTAVAQSNLLTCYNWWTAFALSAFASIVTIAAVVQKFSAIVALEKTIKNETDTRQECINRANRLRNKRAEFNFDIDALDGKPRNFPQTRLLWSFAFVIAMLMIFSGLFLTSIYRVLCHSDESPSAPADSAKSQLSYGSSLSPK